MTTHVTEVGHGLISVERDGDILTGVTTGIPANSFTIRKLASGRRKNGWIIRGGEMVEWHSKALLEHSGSIYATGPQVRGVFVDDALRDESRDRIGDILTIATTLATLEKADISIGQVHTRCMLLLEEGGALVLPPDIARTIREHQDLQSQLRTTELFNHPDQDPKNNAGFFLATVTYFVLTGSYPFVATNSEELHSRIRNGNPVEARYRRYTLRREISAALSGTLGGEAYEASPAVWAERIQTWKRGGFDGELTEVERQEIERTAEAEIRKLDRLFDRKESVRKNWRRWVIIAAIIIVIGMVPATIIRNALMPRATAGYSAEEVVTVFYTSVNTMDHTVMEDAVVDKAGQALIREVTNMFVIDRQRMAVEMQSGFVDAQLWRDEGMPALGANRSPYGVAYLSLEALDAPADEVAYRVIYERWLPNSSDSIEGAAPVAPYVGYLMTDEVKLRQDRDDWVIYELTSIGVEELDMALLRQESDRPSTDQAGD